MTILITGTHLLLSADWVSGEVSKDMTAPLYDVKSHFSEYVTMAENGEVIEITKHGVPTVVIVRKREWDEVNDEYARNHRPSFMESVRKWREETGGLAQEEAEEFCASLERMREEEKNTAWPEENPWE